MRRKLLKEKLSLGMMQAGISGGGSLPVHVDKFFEVRTLPLYIAVHNVSTQQLFHQCYVSFRQLV